MSTSLIYEKLDSIEGTLFVMLLCVMFAAQCNKMTEEEQVCLRFSKTKKDYEKCVGIDDVKAVRK